MAKYKMSDFLHKCLQIRLEINLRADFLSSQKLLVSILLQQKSIMQVLAANISMRISIAKIACECFLPRQESQLQASINSWIRQCQVIFYSISKDTCELSTNNIILSFTETGDSGYYHHQYGYCGHYGYGLDGYALATRLQKTIKVGVNCKCNKRCGKFVRIMDFSKFGTCPKYVYGDMGYGYGHKIYYPKFTKIVVATRKNLCTCYTMKGFVIDSYGLKKMAKSIRVVVKKDGSGGVQIQSILIFFLIIFIF